MARVTVEDCIDKVDNRFDLVLLAAHRARMISSGSQLTVDRDNDKNPVVSLREIADFSISPEDLRAQAQTLTNLGNLMKSTEPQDAENAYRQADSIQQQLADKYPAVPGYKRQLARSHHNLAAAMKKQGDPAGASVDADDTEVAVERMTEEELLKGLEGLAPPEEQPEEDE